MFSEMRKERLAFSAEDGACVHRCGELSSHLHSDGFASRLSATSAEHS